MSVIEVDSAVDELTAGAALDGAEIMYALQNDADVQITVQQIDDFVATSAAADAIAAHLLASDPHAQYTTAAELATALGSYPLRTQVGYACTFVTGMAADGVTDDTAAVQTWLAAAAAAGVPADGLGKTIAFNGASASLGIDISAIAGRVHIFNTIFKDLAPNNSSRKMFYGEGNDSVWLDRCQFLRNGSGSSGSLNAAAAVWIKDCPDFKTWDCEVTGNNKGSGIVAQNCPGNQHVRPYIHDMYYVHTSETDDVLHGIWQLYSDGFLVDHPRVAKMGRDDQTADQRDRFARCFVASGCWGGRVVEPDFYRCDQQADITGSGGNFDIQIIGGTFRFPYSHAGKAANSARNCKFIGCNVIGAGLVAFTAGGPVSDQLNATNGVEFIDCTASNTGCFNGTSSPRNTASNIKSFSAERGSGSASPYSSYPKNVLFKRCKSSADSGAAAVTVSSTTALAIASANTIPLSLGVRARFTTSGTLPTGLALSTDYWIVPIRDTMTFMVADSANDCLDAYEAIVAGTSPDAYVVSTLAGGSGTHTMTLYQDVYDDFFNNVAVADLDTSGPNLCLDCHPSGLAANKAYNGFYAPIATIVSDNTLSVSDSTDTVLAINEGTATSDPFNIYSSGVFTAPHTDTFLISLIYRYAANAIGLRRTTFQLDTGGGYANVLGGFLEHGNNGAGTEVPITATYQLFLAKGHKVRFITRQNSTGALNVQTEARITFAPMRNYGVSV